MLDGEEKKLKFRMSLLSLNSNIYGWY